MASPMGCCARSTDRARIATCAGDSRRRSRSSAAPGLRTGRGSQRPPRDRTCRHTAAAPGLRTGRGSQPHRHVRRCRQAGLRPVYGPGEDRNLRIRGGAARCGSLLRPVYGPGEDRNKAARRITDDSDDTLRPVYGPGEDRNSTIPRIAARVFSVAAPGLRTGRGSQLGILIGHELTPLRAAPGLRTGRGSQPHIKPATDEELPRCARSTDRARIATRPPRRVGPAHPSCARSTDRARIATTSSSGSTTDGIALRPVYGPGEDRNSRYGTLALADLAGCARSTDRARIATVPTWPSCPGVPAAPGLRTGRGSQVERL